MTRVQYKNWKSEIAWLRRLAKNCRDLELSNRGLAPSNICDSIAKISASLYARAEGLEKAKSSLDHS